MVKMKRLIAEPECLINVKSLPELQGIHEEADGLVIGAAVPLAQAEKNALVMSRYSALFEALRSMAAIAVRNMGTIGGNLANASPAADTAPPLIVLGADLRLASARGGRTVPVEIFFRGPGLSVLEPDELIVAIRLPAPAPNEGSAFLKLGRVSCDISKINTAVWLKREGSRCADCRIAFGSVAPTPIRAPALEKMVIGMRADAHVLHEATLGAGDAISPISDARSTRDYRRMVAPVLLEEALRAAWTRSGGAL
jgi:CO/xanthine dehydrogenase FAD-binding subunit